MSGADVGKSRGRSARPRAIVAIVVFIAVVGLILMMDPDNRYLWLKSFHIMAVIAWMAGLFYLPRLFIYHFDTEVGSDASELFKVMEKRLYGIIMNPAMMIAWGFGLYLAWDGFGFQGGWLHAKLACVVILTGTHVYFGRAVRGFAGDGRPGSSRHWRLMNEVPTLLMIAIVVLVVVKPF